MADAVERLGVWLLLGSSMAGYNNTNDNDNEKGDTSGGKTCDRRQQRKPSLVGICRARQTGLESADWNERFKV